MGSVNQVARVGVVIKVVSGFPGVLAVAAQALIGIFIAGAFKAAKFMEVLMAG